MFLPDHASKVVGFWPMDRVEIDAYVSIKCGWTDREQNKTESCCTVQLQSIPIQIAIV